MKLVRRTLFFLLIVVACSKFKGDQGPTGPQGPQGDPGPTGPSGQSCTVLPVSNGANIVCGDQVVTITNGLNGQDGSNGAPGTNGLPGTTVNPVTFCPDIAGSFPEVGFYINNVLFAVYYDSNGAHMTQVTAGSYVTTDGRNCHFTVDGNGNIISEN